MIARASLHHWEEPPISGSGGSGTVFFSHCALRCVNCQNSAISHGEAGTAVSLERLATIFLELQEAGAHNINLVTPSHYAAEIVAAVRMARAQGLALPIVYNTSGYETCEAIAALAGTADVFLTDFKYASPALASRYSGAEDYPEVALAALRRMVLQTGEYREAGGILQSGVIVRHLLLPGCLEDSLAVLDLVHGAVGNQVCYSLMNQYTPPTDIAARGFPELARPVTEAEYSALIDHALALGITGENSYMQEGGTASESFIPAFDLTGVL